MTHSISFAERNSIIVGKLTGLACLDGFRAYVTELLQPPYAGVPCPILSDLTELDARSISAVDIRKLVEFVGSNRDQIGPNRHAILVSQPLSFGLARMYELLAQESDPQPTNVFDNREKALHWLMRGEKVAAGLRT